MIVIGEKLNGFVPKTLQAIENKNELYLRNIAKAQQECKADYLDICAGVEPEREMEVMEWLIQIAQEETSLPLCLDNANPEILLQCIPLCEKPGIVNSVSMESGKIEAIFPVIADSDWKVIALTCDDDGIPDTPAGKLAIARKIIAAAESYDICQDRIFIDPLVTTLATKQDSLLNFVETIKLIKEEFPQVHFTSGLSNISFGIPFRRGINMMFLCLAMNAGMDSAILDPTSPEMIGALLGTAALLGQDSFNIEYLTAYRDGMLPVKPTM